MLLCKHACCVTIYYLVKCLCRKKESYIFHFKDGLPEENNISRVNSTGRLTLKMYDE